MAGRPSKYNNRTNKQALFYLENFDVDGDVIPTIEGLAEHLGICRDTVYDWSDQDNKKEFSYILTKILQKQAKILLNKGLTSEFNSVMAKLMLSKHGYVEKKESESIIHVTTEQWLEDLD